MTATDTPATGGAAARFVGQSIKRKEDPRLLAGRGRYADDVSLPGQLHIAFVRSDVPAGKIRGIDVTAARALPGVHAVLTGADLNPVSGPLWTTTMGPPAAGPPMRPLAGDDVRFVGDPIAMVIATSRYIAEDGAELVEVDIEPTKPVASIQDAMADDAPLVHPELGTNVFAMPLPPDPAFEQVLADAAHVITRTFTGSRMTNVPMEGRGMVASYDQFSGELRVWPSTQSPHEIKAFGARVTGIDQNRVHVEFGDVGGGFGQKMFPTREEAAVLLAAKIVGRPVKWIEDRRENLISANQARNEFATVTMAVDADGQFLAASVDFVKDVGSYPHGGAVGGGGGFVAMLFTGPYRIPLLRVEGTTVVTNTCGEGPFRGPWAIECIAREQMVDAVAQELGLDPLELRRRNIIHQSDLPYTLPSFLTYDVVTPEETLEQAVEMLGWDDFRARQAAAREEGRYLGVGLSVCIEPSAVGMGAWGTEAATIRIDVSGKVELLMGSGSHGQSTETTMPQIVADHLGCSIDDVVLRQGGDTPYGPGTGGSRTAVILGGAAQSASIMLREKVVAIAAHLLEAAPDDLEVANSIVSVKGTPAKALSFAELAATAYFNSMMLPPGSELGLEATNRFQPPSPFTWSNATHLCVAEVDPETGFVKLERFIVSEDCGTMINPMVVEGQIAGGVVQGIGQTMFEEMAYDAEGNPQATTFLDYLIPTASDVPILEYGHIETQSNTLGGYKGMGEGGAIAAPAAVANAINDALAPLGARVEHFPITPTKVLAAIEAARG